MSFAFAMAGTTGVADTMELNESVFREIKKTCSQVSEGGYNLSVDGAISGKVGGIFKHLFGMEMDAGGGGKIEYWKGIQQVLRSQQIEDNKDYRDCVEFMFQAVLELQESKSEAGVALKPEKKELSCSSGVLEANGTISLQTRAICCVQRQLNRIGFQRIEVDGYLGPDTLVSSEAYRTHMSKKFVAQGWRQPALDNYNAEHWCEKVAEAHPQTEDYYLEFVRLSGFH